MVEQINPLQSTASKNKSKDIHLPSIDVSFASNRILYDSVHRYPTCLLTLSQLWGISYTRVRQALWHYRPKRCREVNSPPAYRYARGSYSRTYLYPLCGAGSTVYFIFILPYVLNR